MLRITGYSDKYTSFPGEEIKFFSDLSQLTFVKVVSFNKENN